jgi:DNA polymerase I
MLDAVPFREIWAVDFEFLSEAGERPEPVCVVGWELKSGRKIQCWRDQLGTAPPCATDSGALFVAYYASDEIGRHLALGWPPPERVLDLFAEFRNRTNGVTTGSGSGLLSALAFHGLEGTGAIEKDEMRALILRGPWSEPDQVAILDYCQSDVRH